jgi:hypothetical protein
MSHTTEFTCKHCGKDTTVEGLADIPVCPVCRAWPQGRMAFLRAAQIVTACIEQLSVAINEAEPKVEQAPV